MTSTLSERQEAVLRAVGTQVVTIFEFRRDMPALIAMGLAKIGHYDPDRYFLTPAGEAALEMEHA